MNVDEMRSIRELFPVGGWPAVRERCPHLTEGQVRSWACRQRLKSGFYENLKRQGKRMKRGRIVKVRTEFPMLSDTFSGKRHCVRLRKWRGPVMAGPLVATIGRTA